MVNFNLKKPCKTCPFVEANDFRLNPDRIREIADASTFACHNTVDYDREDPETGEPSLYRDKSGEEQCFGWLVVQWAEYEGFPNVTALAARMGMFDPLSLPSPDEVGCFHSFEEYAQREEER